MEKEEVEQKILNEDEETLDENQNSDYVDSDISEDMDEDYDPDEELPSYLKEEAEEIEDREELRNKYKDLLSSKTMSELLKDRDSPIIINIHSSGNYIIAAGKTNTVNGSIIGSKNRMSDSDSRIIFSKLPNKCPPSLRFKGDEYSGHCLVNICKPYTAKVKDAELFYTNYKSPYLKLTIEVNIFEGKTITITDTIGLNYNSISRKGYGKYYPMLPKWRALLEIGGKHFRKNQYKALEKYLIDVREHGYIAKTPLELLKKKASLSSNPVSELEKLKKEKEEAKQWIKNNFLCYFRRKHLQVRLHYSVGKSAYHWKTLEDGTKEIDRSRQVSFLKLKVYRYAKLNTRQTLDVALSCIKESIRQLERAKSLGRNVIFPSRKEKYGEPVSVDLKAAISELALNLYEETLIHG